MAPACRKDVATGNGGKKLTAELQRVNPSNAQIQEFVLADLRQIGGPDFVQRFGFVSAGLVSAAEVPRFGRDLRNYDMHPTGALAPETEIMGASGYLGRVASIVRGLQSGSTNPEP